MHFPSDVLGGWILGFALFLGAVYSLPHIEKKLAHKNIYKLLSLHLFVTLSLIVSLTPYPASSYMGCSIGITLGLLLCHMFKVHLPTYRGAKEFFLRAFISVGGVFLITFFLPLPKLFNILLASLWMSLISPWILKKKIFSKGRS